MTLTFEQLMQTNLKGYTFNDRHKGHTRSGFGIVDEYKVVLEDNEDYCLVADLDTKKWKEKWLKRPIAHKIAYSPLLKWNEDTKDYVNDIEQL